MIMKHDVEKNTAPATGKKRGVVVISVLLAAAILLCVLIMGQVLSKGYVSLGGYSLFRVVTGSMEPEIPVGAVLVAKDVPISQIMPKDVVTYRSRESGMFNVMITHRVISVHEGNSGKVYLETKGDANPHADASFVDEDYLIGKVIFYTGQNNIFTKILSFITSRIGFLGCIVLPCVLIGMIIMRDSIHSMRVELDTINQQIDTILQDTAKSPEQQTDEEDYEALCERLRNELIKELKQGAEQETTEQMPGAGQQ